MGRTKRAAARRSPNLRGARRGGGRPAADEHQDQRREEQREERLGHQARASRRRASRTGPGPPGSRRGRAAGGPAPAGAAGSGARRRRWRGSPPSGPSRTASRGRPGTPGSPASGRRGTRARGTRRARPRTPGRSPGRWPGSARDRDSPACRSREATWRARRARGAARARARGATTPLGSVSRIATYRGRDRACGRRRAGPSPRPCYATGAAPIPQRLDRRVASALVPGSGGVLGRVAVRGRMDRSIGSRRAPARAEARPADLRRPPRRLRDRACRAPASGSRRSSTSTTRARRSSARASRGATSRVSRRSTRGSCGRPSASPGASVASLTALKYAVLAVAYAFAYLTARRILVEPRARPARGVLAAPPPARRVVRPRRPHAERGRARGRRRDRVRADPARGRAHRRAATRGSASRSALGHPVEAHLPRLRRRPRAGGADHRPLPAAPPGSAGDRDPPGGGRPAPAVRALARRPPGRPRALRPAGRPRRRALLRAGVLDGLGAVLRALAYYAAPLGLLFLALFPEVYRGRPRAAGRESPAGRLVERTLLAGLALLVGGAAPEPPRPAEVPLGHPALLPPAALRVLAPRSAGDRRRPAPAPRACTRGSWRSPRRSWSPGSCSTSTSARTSGLPARLNTPYDVVAGAIAADGFRRGTIVAGPGPLGGNLRLAFPDSRVASLETPGLPAAARGRRRRGRVSPGLGPRNAATRSRTISARGSGRASTSRARPRPRSGA